MDVYTARQPIFNTNRMIFGYELLFRDGLADQFSASDGDQATSRVVSNTFLSTGIERITAGRKVFINFTRDLILNNIALILPPERAVIELHDDVEPEDEILAACKNLRNLGYSLAFDNFIQYHPRLDPLIELTDIIKIDFRTCDPKEIEAFVKQFLPRGKKLLAEKIETHDEFRLAASKGFAYFQGFFFSKPQTIVEHDIPALKFNMLQIMAELNKESASLKKLKEMIERDVGLSFKLLRYLNSPFFRQRCEITSIQHALALLGDAGLSRFLSVIMVSDLVAEKPTELLKNSVIRARMCELLAMAAPNRIADTGIYFTLGLFSLIDAILDDHMESIMDKIPLAQTIKAALLGKPGELGDYLLLAISWERGEWEKVAGLAKRLGIVPEKLPGIYQEAIIWADALDYPG